jgi:hemerythrin superfamily protein
MNAIELLTQQHREVEDIFEAIEKAKDTSKKAALFRELAAKLVGHDGIEREIFYPACEDALGMSDLLGESLVEHGVVEFCLYEADQAVGEPEFDFKVKVLKEMIEHHVEEEEGELFPKVKKVMNAEALESLGEDMQEAFDESQEEDFHEPLFTNLRQVLAGVLKPIPKADGDKRESERVRSPRKRKSA